MSLVYTRADELGDAGLFWRDSNGTLISFASGYTFVAKIYDQTGTALVTKSSGITGAAGDDTTTPRTPNVTVAWAAVELDITPGTYPLFITATRTADSKTRTFRTTITILDATS